MKINLKGVEEFAHVLGDLGLDRAVQKSCCATFQTHYLERLNAINTVYEDKADEEPEVPAKVQKKFPLNLSA